jgi:hypothetical protein
MTGEKAILTPAVDRFPEAMRNHPAGRVREGENDW